MLAAAVAPTPTFPTPGGARAEGALGPYLRALKARPWIVLLTVVAALGAAAALLTVRTDRYEATAEMLVTPLPQDDRTFLGFRLLRDSGDPTRTVQTAASVVRSPRTAIAVAERIPGFSRSSVESAVEVEPVGESNIIAVTAEDESPALAQRLANTYAQESLATRAAEIQPQIRRAIAVLRGSPLREDRIRLGELQAVADRGDPTLSITSPAARPRDPTGPPDAVVAVLAVLAGLVLGAIAAVLMARVDRHVRDVDELLEEWPLPVLSRIPPAPVRRRSPLDQPPAIRESFRTLQIQLGHGHPDGATILFSSASSNDGKTSSAINLALAFVGAGHSVLIIDFDLRKPDVGTKLSAPASAGLVALLGSDMKLADLAQPVAGVGPLKIVPAVGRQGDHVLLSALARRMEDILAEARALADFVIIDTAPIGEIGDTLAIAALVDEIILVGRPGITDRASLRLARELLQRSGTSPSGWVIIGDQDVVRSSYYEEDSGSSGGRRKLLAGRS